jgi:GH25 family lysozyme M1 (1,4-beta-N-acetylmuramidase)
MTFPPAEVSSLPLGVDVYAGNTYKGAAINAAGFTNLRDHGKTFAILKSSQGTQPDGQFSTYYALAQNSGLIRGSYHFYANPQGTLPFHSGTVQQQADLVVSLVNRLVPGDLAPALDLEDEPRGASNRYPLDQGIQPTENGYHYRHIAAYADHGRAGLDALLTDVGEFMFRLETALGRPPLIYTSVMWMDSDMMNNPTVMFKFPLWTVNHGRTALLRDIQVGGWGSNWTFMQYAEDG